MLHSDKWMLYVDFSLYYLKHIHPCYQNVLLFTFGAKVICVKVKVICVIAVKLQIRFSKMLLGQRHCLCQRSGMGARSPALSSVTLCLALWYSNFNPNLRFLRFLAYLLKTFFSWESRNFLRVFWLNLFFPPATFSLAWDKHFWSNSNKEIIFRKKTLACGLIKTLKEDTAQVLNMTRILSHR